MGSTVRTIMILASVPDHRDQYDEQERWQLWEELQEQIAEVATDVRYTEIRPVVTRAD